MYSEPRVADGVAGVNNSGQAALLRATVTWLVLRLLAEEAGRRRSFERLRKWIRPAAPNPLVAGGSVTTERLLLRRAEAADAEGVAETIDSVVVEAQGWTADTRRHWLEGAKLLGSFLDRGLLVVCDRTGDRILGVVALSGLDQSGRIVEIGWWMGPKARGQGLGTEALAAAIALLHDRGVERVVLGTREDNTAVRAVLAKVGARVTDTRLHRLPDGALVPSVWYVHELRSDGPKGGCA